MTQQEMLTTIRNSQSTMIDQAQEIQKLKEALEKVTQELRVTEDALAVSMNGDWIKVEDDLPVYDQKVIVWGETSGMSPNMGGAYAFITKRIGTPPISRFRSAVDDNNFIARYVTHWMPLPQKPTS